MWRWIRRSLLVVNALFLALCLAAWAASYRSFGDATLWNRIERTTDGQSLRRLMFATGQGRFTLCWMRGTVPDPSPGWESNALYQWEETSATAFARSLEVLEDKRISNDLTDL